MTPMVVIHYHEFHHVLTAMLEGLWLWRRDTVYHEE